MLKVKLETHTGENGKWHDLMTKDGVDSAYQHLDDMIETTTELKKMMDDEVILFKKIYVDGTHEPMEIARSILQNELKYIEDVDEEIWETVYFGKEQKMIAILHQHPITSMLLCYFTYLYKCDIVII